MSRIFTSLVAAAVIGQVVGLIGWIDPIFIPFVLAAPLVTGAVAASRGVAYAWIAALWASAGLCMLWTDWLVNQEDVLFHLGTAVVMPLLAGVGWAASKGLSGGSRSRSAAGLAADGSGTPPGLQDRTRS